MTEVGSEEKHRRVFLPPELVRQARVVMDVDHRPKAIGCARCATCPIQDCPAQDEQGAPALYGRRLALASMGLFVSPVVLAIAGAAAAGGSESAQFAGGVAGLGVGLVASVAFAKLLHRGNRESA